MGYDRLQERGMLSLTKHSRIWVFTGAPKKAVYRLQNAEAVLIVGVYIDNLIVTGSCEEKIADFKNQMKKVFDMSDLGLLTYYIGIEVKQSKKGITISQMGYAKKLLTAAGMADCNEAKYPMEPKLSFDQE